MLYWKEKLARAKRVAACDDMIDQAELAICRASQWVKRISVFLSFLSVSLVVLSMLTHRPSPISPAIFFVVAMAIPAVFYSTLPIAKNYFYRNVMIPPDSDLHTMLSLALERTKPFGKKGQECFGWEILGVNRDFSATVRFTSKLSGEQIAERCLAMKQQMGGNNMLFHVNNGHLHASLAPVFDGEKVRTPGKRKVREPDTEYEPNVSGVNEPSPWLEKEWDAEDGRYKFT